MRNEIGSKIKTLRKGRGLTQQELSEKIGLNRATISNYEVGRRVPHLPELKMFADYFGVGLDYFGVATKDEIFDLLSRAREIFNNPNVPKKNKNEIYKEMMKLYLSIDENNGGNK